MMLPWNKRPVEIAHLLNPAFCSIVLRESILGYEKEIKPGMPFALAFLVLPLVLHKQTREMLPISIATKFHSWIHKNQSLSIGFDTRAQQLVPYTREALYFGTKLGIFLFSEAGRLQAPSRSYQSLNEPPDSESEVCKKKARLIGRWFTRAGDPSTIFALLGVKP